jgi:hypothetical protein
MLIEFIRQNVKKGDLGYTGEAANYPLDYKGMKGNMVPHHLLKILIEKLGLTKNVCMNSLNLGLGSIKTDKRALTPVDVIRKHAKGCLEEKNSHLLIIFVDKIGKFRVGHQNIVIIDKKNKKVVFFEPRGKVGSKFADIFRGVDLDLKKDRDDISATATGKGKNQYEYIPVYGSQSLFGADNMYCRLYCILFALVFLNNYKQYYPETYYV